MVCGEISGAVSRVEGIVVRLVGYGVVDCAMEWSVLLLVEWTVECLVR